MTGFSQDIKYRFVGAVVNQNTGKKEEGIKVTVYKGGQKVASGVTASNGKYEFNYTCPIASSFDIVFEKPGIVTKLIKYDGSKMIEEDIPAGSEFPIQIRELNMFNEIPGVDFSFLKTEPVVTLFWDADKFDNSFNQALYDKMKKKIEDAMKNAPKAEDPNEKKYKELVGQADLLMAQKKYDESISKYEEALGVKPKEKYPADKILEIEKLLADKKKEENAAAQADQEYKNLIAAADNLRDMKKYDDAIAKYTEAQKKKATDPYPGQQITAVNKLKEEEKNKAAQEAKFKELVSAGETAYKGNKLEEAKTKFEEALKIKQDAIVKSKVDEITKKIAEESAKQQAKAKYDALIAEGTSLQGQSKLTEAKAKFQEAGKLDPTQTVPPAKIKEIDDLIAKQAADKQKTDKYNAAITAGEQLLSSGKLPEAKAKYQEAASIDPTQSVPKQKITEIDGLITGKAAEAEKKAKVDKLIADGTTAFGKNELVGAKAKFEEALKLDAGNSVAQTKLNAVNAKINAQKSEAEKQQQFEKLKAEGMQLASDKKWDQAKSKLNEAISIKSDATITAKIKEIDLAIAAEKAQAGADAEYTKLMNDAEGLASSKKYDEAIAKYKEASAKKPNETLPKNKITELENLKKNAANQAQIDAKYTTLMKEGDNLVAQKKYVEAIKKFNEALSVKPSEKDPVDKAKAAEALAEGDSNDAKQQYEKIITVIGKSIDEKDFTRAKELIDRAKNLNKQSNFVPGDKRPDEFLAQIAAIELKEKNYKEKITLAGQAEKAKEYQKAITLYTDAKGIKPEETLPQQKIDELNKLLNASSADAEKQKQYQAAMSLGEKNIKEKKYDEAIKSFENALKIIPNDSPATNKIAEVKQLMDNLANKQKNDADKKLQFDKYIKEGDASFASKDYANSKSSYEKALELFPSDKYAFKQILEIDRLIRESSSAEKEKAYQAAIKSGEEKYKAKDYLKAKDEYSKALEIKPKDALATKKLNELDVLLNSNTGEIKLDPLGDPIDANLVDAMAELNKAEIARKKLEAENLKSNIKNVSSKEESLSVQKSNEHLNTDKAVDIQENKIDETNKEKDLNRVETVNTYRNIQTKAEQQDISNNTFEKNDNINAKEKIHATDVQVQQVNESKSTYSAVNESKLVTYKTHSNAEKDDDGKIEHEENITSNQKVRAIELKQTVNPVNDDDQRKDANLIIHNDNKKQEENFVSTEDKEANERQSADKQIHILNGKIDAETVDQNQRPNENSDGVKIVDKNTFEKQNAESLEDVEEGVKITKEVSDLVGRTEAKNVMSDEGRANNVESLKVVENKAGEEIKGNADKDVENGFDANKKMDNIKTVISQNDIPKDNNRTEAVEQLKTNDKARELADIEQANKENEKYLSSKGIITDHVRKDVGTTEAAKIKSDDSNLKVKEVQQKAISTEQNETEQNNNKIKEGNLAIHDLHSTVIKSTENSNNEEKVNNDVLQNVQKSMSEEHANDAAVQTDKYYKSQQELNNTRKEPEAKPIAKNALGNQYPEGVSQESFTQKDEHGLMTAVITRRIVVVEGQGNVYVRTQTLQATTYSKNGQPITEYVWQKETQAAGLKRNY